MRKMARTGRFYEEFEVGATYQHHWGRTLAEAECHLFTTWTQNANPLLVMNVVFGMTVEDLSEQALAHLGYWAMVFHKPVYPGQTLYAESVVLDKRESGSKDDRGIVHVRTTGKNELGAVVLSYERKILVKRRSAYASEAERTSPPGLKLPETSPGPSKDESAGAPR